MNSNSSGSMPSSTRACMRRNRSWPTRRAKTQARNLRDLFKQALANDKITIQVQSLKGDHAPAALILLPEQMRRINDMGALMEQRLPGLPDHHVLLVNRRHPLVEGLLKLSSGAVLTTPGGSRPPPASSWPTTSAAMSMKWPVWRWEAWSPTNWRVSSNAAAT
jgi:hypothetical protein